MRFFTTTAEQSSNRRCALALCFALVPVPLAAAEQAAPEHADRAPAQSGDAVTANRAPVVPPPARQNPIEEIEVIGQRSLIQLRLEIKQAEVAMFELFNELNSRDEFDVNCGEITHTGTLIPTWECDAGYIRRARLQNVQDFRDFGAPLKSEQDLWWENRHKTEQLNAEMKTIAKENPDLAKAMIELHAKRERLVELEREKREATRGFFSRLFGGAAE